MIVVVDVDLPLSLSSLKTNCVSIVVVYVRVEPSDTFSLVGDWEFTIFFQVIAVSELTFEQLDTKDSEDH